MFFFFLFTDFNLKCMYKMKKLMVNAEFSSFFSSGWWTGCWHSIQDLFLTQCSCYRLRNNCNTHQNKALTEKVYLYVCMCEWMNEWQKCWNKCRMQLRMLCLRLKYFYSSKSHNRNCCLITKDEKFQGQMCFLIFDSNDSIKYLNLIIT